MKSLLSICITLLLFILSCDLCPAQTSYDRLLDSLDKADLHKMKALQYRVQAKASAQKLDFSYIRPPLVTIEDGTGKITYQNDSDATFPISIGQFFSDWKAYKAECWNDSSYQTDYSVDIESGYWFIDNDGVIRSHAKRWFHREPTLDGFMEWLERRYK